MIIVSFSTLPSRINRIGPMLDSIWAQTLQPDRFVLLVPVQSIREKCPYVIPEFVWERAEVINCPTDYGPATKLIPAIEMLAPEDILITVDDDVVYEPHMIEELVEQHKQNPGKRLGFMGIKGGQYIHAEFAEELVECDVLGGYRGVLYPPSSLKSITLLDLLLRLNPEGICLCDDELFHRHAIENGFRSYVIPTKHKTVPNAFPGLNFRFLNLGNGVCDKDNLGGTLEMVNKLKSIPTGK
jgi:hypothetical protein